MVLHTEADILAQIINIALLSPPMNEKQVGLSRLVFCDKVKLVAPAVSKSMQTFEDSKAFRYVSGFCNVTKHRRNIPAGYRIKYGPGNAQTEGIVIGGFSYHEKGPKAKQSSGPEHEEEWAMEVVKKQALSFQQHIVKIGNEINRHLRGAIRRSPTRDVIP